MQTPFPSDPKDFHERRPAARSNNPAAFNRSLKDRIRNETTPRGRTTEQLRREFFLQCFLARVFSQPKPLIGDRAYFRQAPDRGLP